MHLILIPTYNERENILSLLDAVLVYENVHVLVIDDASPDGTSDAVKAHAQFGERVFLFARDGKEGLGVAYRAGFAWGLDREYETLTQMDADFSHDPKDLPRLFAEIAQGADVVIGSRKVRGGRIEGWGPWRKFCSTGAMAASRVCLGLRTKDVTAGFRTWRKDFVLQLPVAILKSNGYAFQEEMILVAEQIGGKVIEVPVVFRDRVRGTSKLGASDVREFFVTLLRLTLQRRRQFIMYLFVGAVGACVDLGLFLLLHHYFTFTILSANVIATSVAVLHNFLWHHFVTFKDHGNMASVALGMFVFISVIGIAVNSLVVLAGVAMGLLPVLAKIVAILVVTVWNYVLNSRVTFRK
jgi:dolichol-phosphate mannosyltransferase